MPLYEYLCDACGHRFEVIQKFSDPLVDICPVCGSHVSKLISSPAIQFKGSGFYITDYPKDGAAGNRKESGEAAKEKDAKETDSKEKNSKDKDSKEKDSKQKESSGGDKGSGAKTEKSSTSDTTAAAPAPAATPTKKD